MNTDDAKVQNHITLRSILVIGLSVSPDTMASTQLQNLSNEVQPLTIGVEGGIAGWDSTPAYSNDPSGDLGAPGQIDWSNITIAHDCDDLYVRYQTHAGPELGAEGYRYNLYLDVDRNTETGFRGGNNALSIGADLLIQGGPSRVTLFSFHGDADQEAWAWKETTSYPVSDRPTSTGGRDISYNIRTADLDVFGVRTRDFDWVASADYPTPISDFYPDGAYLSDGGTFNTYTIAYAMLPAGVTNPERGFAEPTETHSTQYLPLDLETLRCYRLHEGTTLIQRHFYLENFVNADISADYLDFIASDLDTIREAGLKVIPRFAYSGSSSAPPYGDASKDAVLRHIGQLGPLLSENSDIIAVVQAGFIGLWGEWWYSDHFQPDSDWTSRADVLYAFFDVLPSNRKVQVRTPRYKANIFQDLVPLDGQNAHSESDIARTAHHNDCFLSSASDGGTYVDVTTEYPYLQEETKWVPMGGETCDYRYLSDKDPDRLACPSALEELARFHWSFLNVDWYQPTLRQWSLHGCLPEIRDRLGYDFVLSQLTVDDIARPGGDLSFSFELKNRGFAAPYNPRDVDLVLRGGDGATRSFKLDQDPRFWLAGDTQLVRGVIRLPEDLPLGKYELLLHLPDPEPALSDRPEYAIALSNQGAWESQTGYNNLHHVVSVNALPTVEKERTFESIPSEDGWILESNRLSGIGGNHEANDGGRLALRLGDDSGDRQYKSILSFDTSPIPDSATIKSARLELTRGGTVGKNPFSSHGTCYLDVRSGGFRGKAVLQDLDFQAKADATQAEVLSEQGGAGKVYSVDLMGAQSFINKKGRTQLRLYFAMDNNHNGEAEVAGFFAGESRYSGRSPKLVLTYE